MKKLTIRMGDDLHERLSAVIPDGGTKNGFVLSQIERAVEFRMRKRYEVFSGGGNMGPDIDYSDEYRQ